MKRTVLLKLLSLLLLLNMPQLVFAESFSPSVAQQSLVNINQASVEELANRLKGIGHKRAQAIVDYRNQIGQFTSIEQLTEVPGISRLIIEKNRAILTL